MGEYFKYPLENQIQNGKRMEPDGWMDGRCLHVDGWIHENAERGHSENSGAELLLETLDHDHDSLMRLEWASKKVQHEKYLEIPNGLKG